MAMTTKDYFTGIDIPPVLLWEKMASEVQDYAFIILDKNGIILNWNKGAETIKGYRSDEIVGKSFKTFYTREDQDKNVPGKFIALAEAEGRAGHEGWRVRKDGSLFWASVTITALHNEARDVIGFSKVTRDLTERKYTEDLLREKNQELERINQELSSFAYVASHDLQEPLRKIQTFASRILEMEKDSFSEKSKEYFTRMQNASARMQTLIQDLLTYSRSTSSNSTLENIDLNEILEGVRTDLEETIIEKKAVIKSDKLPSVRGVRFQFQQLFLNLIGNALKFSKQDVPALITISSSTMKGALVTDFVADPRKNYYHFIFADNGIGFEPEFSNKIFEVFQRLHGKAEYSGTGIGLSICKKIIENYKGFIFAVSEPDKGATFHVYLPIQ
jgi:PAS domain S-box-containing protein